MHKHSILSRDFVLVAIGQIISLFGNQMLRYALPLYLLSQTGSSALLGTVSACAAIPMILLFPIGGILAARMNKRNIMVILDLGTAVLIALFSLLAGSVRIVPLTAATMIILYGVQGAYQPAVKASVPVLVENVMQGNSVVDLIGSLSGMVGPMMGGVLYSLAGLEPVLWLSIGCFFASAVMELFIRIPFARKPAAGNPIATGLEDLTLSVRFLLRERPVLWRMALVYGSVNLFLTSLVLIAVPVLVTQRLGFAESAASRLYGVAQAVLAAGAVLGGVLAGVLSKRLRLRSSPWLLLGCALSVLLAGTGFLLPAGPMAAYLALVTGCGLLIALSTLFQIQLMSHLQMLTPDHLIGKVTASVICVCMCASPIGQFLYGLVFEGIGGRVSLPFCVAGLVGIGISVLSRGIFREADRQPESATGPLSVSGKPSRGHGA